MNIIDLPSKIKSEIKRHKNKLGLTKHCIAWMNQELTLRLRINETNKQPVKPWQIYYVLYDSKNSFERKLFLLRMESDHYINLGYLQESHRQKLLNGIWKKNQRVITKAIMESYNNPTIPEFKFDNEKTAEWLMTLNYSHAIYKNFDMDKVRYAQRIEESEWWKVCMLPCKYITGYTSDSIRSKINRPKSDAADLAIEADEGA